MAQVFAHKSTTSNGKYQTEMISDLTIGPILKRLHAVPKRYTVAYLVGCVDGLDRHVTRFENMGVSQRDQVIFEYDLETYKRLQRAIVRRGLKVRIFHECMLAGIKRLSQTEKISCVEFDGVCQYGTFEFDLYKIANQFEIPVLICEGSARGQTPQFKTIAKSLKMKRYANSNGGYMCFKLIPTAKHIISKQLKSYQSEIFTYQGVSNMYMQISIRNEVSL
jgi:hypothetical protein